MQNQKPWQRHIVLLRPTSVRRFRGWLLVQSNSVWRHSLGFSKSPEASSCSSLRKPGCPRQYWRSSSLSSHHISYLRRLVITKGSFCCCFALTRLEEATASAASSPLVWPPSKSAIPITKRAQAKECNQIQIAVRSGWSRNNNQSGAPRHKGWPDRESLPSCRMWHEQAGNGVTIKCR